MGEWGKRDGGRGQEGREGREGARRVFVVALQQSSTALQHMPKLSVELKLRVGKR